MTSHEGIPGVKDPTLSITAGVVQQPLAAAGGMVSRQQQHGSMRMSGAVLLSKAHVLALGLQLSAC